MGESTKNAVIFDLDGTILTTPPELLKMFDSGDKKERTKAFDRLYAAEAVPPAYLPKQRTGYAASDTPIDFLFGFEWALALYACFQRAGVLPIVVTARHENAREPTAEQLRCVLGHVPSLFMRPKSLPPGLPDAQTKEFIYNKYIRDTWDVVLAIDDRWRCVELYRSIGVPALFCGDYK